MRKILLVLAAFIFFKAQAQTPIQVNAQLLPPYSLQVSDYYSPTATGGQKLNLILLNRDFLRSTINVRLRMVIESQGVRIATREDVTWPTVTLISGTPYYVTPAELASYFNPNNLIFSGISQEQYTTTGKLPEGFYTFCFETVEPSTGLTVSNKGCAFAWMTMSDPPFLNIPAKAETVTPNASQNINFQWTPRHSASPNAGFSTDYVFTITEVMANDFSPESAFTSHQALYTDSTQATMYNYGPAKPLLIAGRKYAWRVQAKAKQGLDNLAMFRNFGYSEVFWFDYKNNCTPPLGITAVVQGTRVTISWLVQPIYLNYKVEYREKNNATAEWFTITTLDPTVVINDLNFSKEYEYRVGASCEEGAFNYSNLLAFTTGAVAVPVIANCGDSSGIPNTVAQTYLASMPVGDTIKAGDFKVKIVTISGSGTTTGFTGTGTVKIPWLLGVKAQVKFTGIKVNTLKQLAVGKIETTYDPKEAGLLDIDDVIDIFTAGYGVGGVVSGQAGADTTLGFPILWPGGITASVGPTYNPPTVNGPATITVTGVGGTPVITIVAQTLPKTIMDSTGNIYQVNNTKPVTVTLIGKVGGAAWLAKTNKALIDADKAIVKFVTYTDSATKVKYAFDEWNTLYKKSGTFNKEYEKISCAGGGNCIDGGDYYVSAKAIAPGKTEYLKVMVTKVDNTINPDSIQFVNGKGIIYTKKRLVTAANIYNYEIAVVGGPEKDAQEIYALYPKVGSKTFNLGKVLVASYPRKDYNVTIVPVNGTTPNLQKIKDTLNKIYGTINIGFQVNLKTNFVDTTWDQTNNGLDVKGSNLFTDFTYEMKLLNQAYLKRNTVLSDEIVIFCLASASDTIVLGDMPRGRRFGYLFMNGNTTPERIIAHEIGHGRFSLKHVFDYDKTAFSPLKNLMDYPCGLGLIKYQWDFIFDPAIVIPAFNNDVDNQYALQNERTFAIDNAYAFNFSGVDTTIGIPDEPGFYTIYTPAGIGYKIEKSKITNAQIDNYGTLKSFTIVATGKNYSAYFVDKTEDFTGYKENACTLPFRHPNGITYDRKKSDQCLINMSSAGFVALPNAKLDNVLAMKQFWKAHKQKLINDNPAIRAEIELLLTQLPSLALTFSENSFNTFGFDLIKIRDNLSKKLKELNESKLVLDNLIKNYYDIVKEKIPNLSLTDLKIEPGGFDIIKNAYQILEYRSRLDKSRCLITKFFQENCTISLINHPEYEKGTSRSGAVFLQSLTLQQRKQILNIFYQAPNLTSTSWGTEGPACMVTNFGEEIVVAMLRYATKVPDQIALLEMFKTNKEMLPKFYKEIDNSCLNYFCGGDNFDALIKELIKLAQLNSALNNWDPNKDYKKIIWNRKKDWNEFTLLNHVKFDDNGDIIFKKYDFDLLKGLGEVIVPLAILNNNSDLAFTVTQSQAVDPWTPVMLTILAPDPDIFPNLPSDPDEYPRTIQLPAISVAHLNNKVANNQIQIGVDVAFTALSFGQLAAAKNGLQFVWRAAQVLIPAADAYLRTAAGKTTIFSIYKKLKYPNITNLTPEQQIIIENDRDEFISKWNTLTTFVNVGAMGEGVFTLYKNVRGKVYNIQSTANLTVEEAETLSKLKNGMFEFEQSIESTNSIRTSLPTLTGTLRAYYNTFKNTPIAKWFGSMTTKSKIITKDLGNKIEYYFKSSKYGNQEFKIAEVVDNNGSHILNTSFDNGVPSNYSKYSIDEVTDANILANADGAAIVCEGGGCSIRNGGCFIEGTLISTESGLVGIEKLSEGQMVKTYDSVNNKIVLSKVMQIANRGMGLLRKIVIGTDTIIATPNHLMFTNNGWQQASKLVKGSLLFLASMQFQIVDTVIISPAIENVYNFEVENNHNYFVGKNAVLVHNGLTCPLELNARSINKSNVDGLSPHVADDVIGKIDVELKTKLLTDDVGIDNIIIDIKNGAAVKGSRLTWSEVKALFDRGNNYNRKCNLAWQSKSNGKAISEVNMFDGKRLDLYVPPGIVGDGIDNAGMIISRKATTLSEIQLTTFQNYLKELKAKYTIDKAIKSSKTNIPKLKGNYYLEIPESNRVFYNNSTAMKNLAAEEGVTVIFNVE
jgi:Pretoxin HINT domain